MDGILKRYREMPSLAMKTQFTEMQTAKFGADTQYINEMCLNNQFDATNINQIVQGVLQKTVDDETLRGTLMLEFKNALILKGRVYATADISRRLLEISEMTDPTQADNESKNMSGQLERIVQSIIARARLCQHGLAPIQPVIDLLVALHGIEWPVSTSVVIDQLSRDFHRMHYQTSAQVLAALCVDNQRYGMFKPFIDMMVKSDRAGEWEAQIQDVRIRSVVANARKQLMG
jgi:hypothetical protein